METMINRTIVVLLLALNFGACSGEIKSKFQVSGWNLGNPSHKNVQFLINGAPLEPVVRYGQSSGPFEVDVVVGQSSYNSNSGPTYDVQSVTVRLGVKDVDTNTIFMNSSCYLTKTGVVNMIYELRGGFENLYCSSSYN